MKTNKSRKKVISTVLVLAMIVSCFAMLAGCSGGGSKSVVGTYTNVITGADNLNGQLHGGGFANTTLNDTAALTDTLVLNEDNTYTLTKFYDAGEGAVNTGEDGSEVNVRIKIEFVYHGEYAVDGDTVTLKACTSMDYNEDWGVFDAMGVGPVTQQGTITDPTATANAGLTSSYMATFPGMSMSASAEGNVDQQITLNGSSYSYVEVNLDD